MPSVNKLDELPERAKVIFDYDAKSAIANPDNAEVLQAPKTDDVLAAFTSRIANEPGPITAERFKAIVNEVKTESGVKGKDLFHPIRIAVTGTHSGPEFDKLVPLIEEGSTLAMPVEGKKRERAGCGIRGRARVEQQILTSRCALLRMTTRMSKASPEGVLGLRVYSLGSGGQRLQYHDRLLRSLRDRSSLCNSASLKTGCGL